MKKIKIIDDSTGEIILEQEFSGGYHLIYTNLTDSGHLHHIRELDNAKFGDKHWIKNFIYKSIAKRLVAKFPELKHISIPRVLFIEDMEWKDPVNGKSQWMAKISKANKQFETMSGYSYILETRNHYIEKMSREQIVMLLYHELRHIDKFGDLIPHDVEDWSNLLATVGTDWATTQTKIKNLIDDEIIWIELEPLAKQIDMFSLGSFNKFIDDKKGD